jgi:hypothetical protein
VVRVWEGGGEGREGARDRGRRGRWDRMQEMSGRRTCGGVNVRRRGGRTGGRAGEWSKGRPSFCLDFILFRSRDLISLGMQIPGGMQISKFPKSHGGSGFPSSVGEGYV